MTRPFITLNAAVTWLAFGEQRTPSEELELRRADQQKIINLINACCVEVRDDSRFSSFPRALPWWPLRALVERLDQHRDDWPPSAKKLRSSAVGIEKKWVHYDGEYDRALERIMEAAQRGNLDLLGRVSRRTGAEIRVIPPASLLGDVTIDHLRTNVGPDVTARERPRPFAIMKPGRGLQPIFYNVVLSVEQLRKVFHGISAGLRKAPRKEIDGLTTKWYLERVSEYDQRGQIPSRDADLAVAKELFAGVPKLRDIVRALRRTHAQHWTKKGRRSKKRK